MYDVVRREKIKQRSERNLGKTGVIILCTAVVNWSKTVDLERRFLLLLSLYCTTITGDHCYKDQILLVKLAIYTRTWYRFLIAPLVLFNMVPCNTAGMLVLFHMLYMTG